LAVHLRRVNVRAENVAFVSEESQYAASDRYERSLQANGRTYCSFANIFLASYVPPTALLCTLSAHIIKANHERRHCEGWDAEGKSVYFR